MMQAGYYTYKQLIIIHIAYNKYNLSYIHNPKYLYLDILFNIYSHSKGDLYTQ
jgi:hypothetical protein